MKNVQSWFYIALFFGVSGISFLFASPLWYLNILLTILLGGVLFVSQNHPYRAFYGVCASQPLIIACGLTDIWAGLFVVWMVAGITAGALDLLVSRQDLSWLLVFYGSTLVLAVVVQLSNHVVPLVVLVGAGLGLALAVLTLRDHQFRKLYAGAGP
jgi:hypothetical protein